MAVSLPCVVGPPALALAVSVQRQSRMVLQGISMLPGIRTKPMTNAVSKVAAACVHQWLSHFLSRQVPSTYLVADGDPRMSSGLGAMI